MEAEQAKRDGTRWLRVGKRCSNGDGSEFGTCCAESRRLEWPVAGVAELGIGKSATGVVGVQRPESQGQVGVKLAFQSSEGWIDVWGESGQWLCYAGDSRH